MAGRFAAHGEQPEQLEVPQLEGREQLLLSRGSANGSYVTLLRGTRDQWSTIIETTGGVTGTQRASFAVTGGKALAGRTVHVWSSNFSIGAGPAQWFVRGPDITPVNGKFALTIKPGHVYSLSTTSGPLERRLARPASAPVGG